MSKDEVITLSSDEESDFFIQPKKKASIVFPPKSEIVKSEENDITNIQNAHINKMCISKKNLSANELKRKKPTNIEEIPEVVDLEESVEKIPLEKNDEPAHRILNHSNSNHVDDLNKSQPNISEINHNNIEKNNFESNKESSGFKNKENSFQQSEVINKLLHTISEEIQEKSSVGCTQYYNEFVEFCASLETVPKDQLRLTKKLQKRFKEADPAFVQSQEFKNIIKKSRLKINKNNMYLIAKEVTDQLLLRKKLETINNDNTEENNQRGGEINKNILKDCSPQNKKRIKMLRKITKKLDKLGKKIKELEEAEVDLSDEEGSVYVALQRHRERFCQIYKRLCQIKNTPSDAERVFSRKICFNSSKYPAINKCIENWLNRTKRFPDFTDVMKLLESQSESLHLPSNKDSIRIIATEIFQQVGSMLQRRRKYDLWDSFSGFLDDQRDPAENDVELEKVLKENYSLRINKEQEIFNYYAEKQEKEKLQPEEVPEDEANCSPVESGNDDEKELEKIEKCLNKRLEVAIEDDELSEGDKTIGTNESLNGSEDNESNDETEPTFQQDSNQTKETKNNYKNCKSLKWKDEKKLQSIDSDKVEDSAFESMEKESKNIVITEDSKKEESDLELISEAPSKVEKKLTPEIINSTPSSKLKTLSTHKFPSNFSVFSTKKNLNLNTPSAQKRNNFNTSTKELEVLEIDLDDENTKNEKGAFQIGCCQIQQRFLASKLDFFDDCGDRRNKRSRKKVFRDLTNVNRLLELNGKKKKPVLLFSWFPQYRCFRKLGKPAWKKRSMLNYTIPGQKCALNYDKASEKNVDRGSKDGDERNTQNNSESGADEGSSFLGGNKSGSDEDNNENDENKKKRGSGDEGEHDAEEEEEKEEEFEEEGDKTEDKTQESSVKDSENENGSLEESKAVEDKKAENPTEETSVENMKMKEKQENKKEKEEIVSSNEEERKNESLEEENNLKTTSTEKNTSIETIKKPEGKEPKNSIASPPSTAPVEKKNTGITKENKQTKTTAKDKTDKPGDVRSELQIEIAPHRETSNVQVTRVKQKTKIEERRDSQTRESAPQYKNSAVSSPLKTPAGRIDVESMVRNIRKRNNSNISTSDEERVKQFLLHSPSSISITPPRQLSLPKPPSQAALQALATLRGLKGISATRVRVKPKSEDDVVVISESRNQPEQNVQSLAKRRRSDLPVISNVQSIKPPTPKIITVQGNAPGFGNASRLARPNNGQPASDSSSIRISNVWGGLPNTFYQSMQQNSDSVVPGCSSRQNNPNSTNATKKKTPKKTVEYVVLE